ncbi:MAG: CRISPR-associated endonuclease Cas3'' [Nitrososphaeraceae archaeon]
MKIEDTYTYTNILAKSDPEETLSVHTNNAVIYLKQVIKWYSKNISYACKLLDTSDDEIAARLFAMVYLHDIGKSNPSFQNYIRKHEGIQRPFPPHALMSAPFIISSVNPAKINGIDHILKQ